MISQKTVSPYVEENAEDANSHAETMVKMVSLSPPFSEESQRIHCLAKRRFVMNDFPKKSLTRKLTRRRCHSDSENRRATHHSRQPLTNLGNWVELNQGEPAASALLIAN